MDLALLPERIAEVGMDFGVIWVDANCRAIGGDCGGAMLASLLKRKRGPPATGKGMVAPPS